MNRSESIGKIALALVKAQRNIEAADKSSPNPFFKSKYADLNAVMAACKDALNEQGIAVLQPVTSSPDGDLVETILLHESGEFISSGMKLILNKQDMQAYGSAVSYARRYGLQSMCFVGAEDDDGNKAVGNVSQSVQQPQKPVSVAKTQAEVSQPVTQVSQNQTLKAKTNW